MKKILSVLLVLSMLAILAAQEVEEFNATDTEETIKLEDTKAAKHEEQERPKVEIEDIDEVAGDDIIVVNYRKKSAALAMACSALIPGSGSIYANYRSWTGYVFPILEIALWVGYIHFQKEGLDKEDAYEDYADLHYDRELYYEARDNMMDVIGEDAEVQDIYDETHFRLDETNTQHFYEDIGKYNKYVFGWTDWHNKYGYQGNYSWAWDTSADDPNHKWIGNYPTNPDYNDETDPSRDSALRDEYIDMRQEAEDYYTKADYCTWGIMLNHLVAIIDAYRVTKSYNVEYISKAPRYEFNVQPILCNDHVTPMLILSRKF